MKKLGKSVLLSTLAALAFGAVAVGTTYALFTSEAEASVEVTTGKVNVTAEIKELELYSPTLIAEDGSVKDDSNAATDTRFACGGTVTKEGNAITIDKMVAGDKVTVKYTVKNNSTVAIKYRAKVEVPKITELEHELRGDLKTEWTKVEAGADLTSSDVTMVVKLPTTATGDFAETNKTFKLVVEAVQANAVTTDSYTLPDGVTEESFGENFAYMNGTYYANLTAALKAAAADETYGATVYLKPNAVSEGEENGFDLVEDLTIYGNGATMDSDFAGHGFRVEQYTKFTKDVTLNVYDLNDITAWGNKTTDYTFTMNAENCSFNRVFINGTGGKCNITIKDGVFDSVNGYGDNRDTVYVNADGFITLEDCVFYKILTGVNINHKATGNQDITIKNCEFYDCAVTTEAKNDATNAYRAPIRIYEKEEGSTGLVTISGCNFYYSGTNKPLNDYDILLNKIHKGTEEAKGIITYDVQEGANMYAHPTTTKKK